MLLILSEEAESDLVQIREYTLLNWGENQTNIYLNKLEQKLQKIATFSHLGKRLISEKDIDYRYLVHKKHIIFY